MPSAHSEIAQGAVSPARQHALASGKSIPEFVAPDPQREETLALISQRKAETQVAKVSDYDSILLNGLGRVIGTRAGISIEQKPEDIVDVVAFFKREGKVYVAVSDVNRPALLARNAVDLDVVPEQQSGRMTNLPGAYIIEDGPASAARRVVIEKIGAQPVSDPFRLGGSILPNAGSSPEVAIPFGVEVFPPEQLEMVSYGEKLDGFRVRRFMELQEIVDAYYAGKIHDPRLLEGVLRLAEHLNIELTLPCAQDIRYAAICSPASSAMQERILSSEAARELLRNPPPDSDIVASVQLTELRGDQRPEHPFLEQFRLWVANMDKQGRNVGAPYEIDAVVRQSDALNIGCFSIIDGEPVLAINIGSREALERRESEVHVMHIATEARALEGVSGHLPRGSATAEGLRLVASEIARELTGIETIGKPIALQTYGFWSPGFNTAMYREALVPFDASAVRSVQSTTYFMRASEILELADEGVVRDLGLVQMARRLDAAFPSKLSRAVLNYPPEVLQEYSDLVNSDSAVMQFIREHAPHLRELVKTSPLFSALLATRINQGGIVIEIPEPGSKEAAFFSSHQESYLFHPEMPAVEAAAFLLHDGWHFDHQDRLPFYTDGKGGLLLDSQGRPIVCSQVEYQDSPNFNEVDALTFSEVVIPTLYGVKRFEEEIGTPCVAGLLEGAGIYDFDEQREAVRLMATEGVIPDEVVSFLARGGNFARYERLLHERLVGFYVRDVLNNVPAMYQAWTALPEVAEVAIRMGARAYNDPHVEAETFRERLTAATDRTSSVNQLQAAISSTRTQDIYRVALDIAYVVHLASEHADPVARERVVAEAREQIAALIEAHDTLSDLLPEIRDTERSERNLSAFSRLRAIQADVCKPAAAFLQSCIEDPAVVGAANVPELAGRKYMAFPLIPFGVPDELKNKVPELIAQSFARLTLSVPPGRAIVAPDESADRASS